MGSNALTLWHLLTATCFSIPIAGAVVCAMQAKPGVGGYALVLCGGLVVGMYGAAAMWKGLKYVWSYVYLRPKANWLIVLVYVLALPWLFIVGLLGRWVSFALLRLVV